MATQFKLSEFTSLVAQGITTLFGGEEFLIIGEVSKIKQWNSRFYIELVEYSDNKVIAHAHALVINQSIVWKPLQEWGLKLNEVVGQQLLMTCSVRYHKDYGIQFDIHAISSEFTLGSIKKKVMSVKEELQKMGIFSANKNTSLGFPPYHIAIISSPSSEGLKDFLDTMKESDYAFSYELFETAIHGNSANDDIHKTLQRIYERVKDRGGLDMVLLVRGGGGSSGILWHNDLRIAKGICYMPIPVMMAVGHTSDSFLLDEIAHYSAKTPTDAAYEIIGIYDKCKETVDKLYNQIINSSQGKLLEYRTKVDVLYTNIESGIVYTLQEYKKNIQNHYEFVINSRPEKMLQSGYALLYDEEGKFMKKDHIQDLQEGELIELNIYNRKIIVEVVENREKIEED